MLKNSLKLFFAFGFLSIVLMNCSDDDSEESCSQEEICTSKNVTACCDDNSCYYTFDGKNYPESDLDQLATDLGCSSTSRVAADGRVSVDNSELIERLEALKMRAKSGR